MAKTGVQIRIVSNRLPQISAAIRPAVVNEVKVAAFDIEAKAKAKAPVKTGTLRRSITSQFSSGGLSAVVGPSVLYSAHVEFGTRRMAARPYLRPAAEAVLPRFAAAVKRTLAGLR